MMYYGTIDHIAQSITH